MTNRSAPSPSSWPRRVGVVGLGHIGSALARNLLHDGLELVVFDRSPETASSLVGVGAIAAGAITDLGECDVVLTSLPDDRALSTVTLDKDGLLDVLAAGAVHLSMSTISPDLSARLQGAHAAKGQSFLAAPVLGNPDLAARRELFVILAGEDPARTRLLPLLERLGQRVFAVGARAADASLLKLAGNAMTAVTLQSMGEILALVRKADIDPQVAFDLFTGSLFDGRVHKAYGGKIVAQQYSPPGMALPLALKDLRLVLAQAEQLAVPLPAASVSHDRMVAAVAKGWTGLDWSALGLLAAQEAGIDDLAPQSDCRADEALHHG